MQKPCEDDGYYYAMARVRNSNTAALDYPFVFQNFNQGIFIDVHPYDKIDIDKGREIFEQVDKLIRKNSTAMRLTHPRLNAKDIERIRSYDKEEPCEVYKKLNCMIQSFRDCETDYVAYLTATTYGFERNTFRREWFQERTLIEMYGLKTYIPCGYENILKTEYGDYMTLPPVESRGNWHGSLVIDPDISYRSILPQIRNDIINDKCNLW